MPKELTHWITAERTADLIDEGPVKDAIRRHPHFYYLGAVVYDTPFYADAAARSDGFMKIADVLHGIDRRDTFAPYRHFFAAYSGSPPPEGSSFIAGAFTHYALDITFHPLVNYFSGKYFSRDPKKRILSQLRHRQFESLLDLYCYGTYIENMGPSTRLGLHLQNGGRFARTLRGLSGSTRLVCEIVNAFMGTAEHTAAILPMLKRHALLQRLFFNRVLSTALSVAGGLFGGYLAVAAATCYPLRKKRLVRNPGAVCPFFASPIGYVHPNTGEKLRASADDLGARAAMAAADLINGYQNALTHGRGESYLAGARGKSLEYGCDANEYPDPLYFDIDTPIRDLCLTAGG